MRFETSQHLKLSQQMKLAPRMIQSMEILQLASLALEERVDQELEGNIALELDEPKGDTKQLEQQRKESQRDDTEGERELVTNADNGSADFERLDNMETTYSEAFDNEYSNYRPPKSAARDNQSYGKMEAMANTAARGDSLTDQLIHQWTLAEVDETTSEIGKHLINYIEDDGYLRTDFDTIADQYPNDLTVEQLTKTLEIIQNWLEPTGIGARDLRECLLLQLDVLDENDPDTDRSIERMLVEEHLHNIELNRLPKIAQKANISLEQIKLGLEHLRSLDPRPGTQLTPDSPNFVVPDAFVEFDDNTNQYVATLCDGRLPRLRVNSDYSAMVKDKSIDKSTRKFVDENVRNARWLISAIDQRNSTVLRVIKAVVQHQTDFFDQGPQALKPLPMTQIADLLGVHVATISRAVSGKWLQTPRGILPLRKFFTAGTETADGEDLSWDAVKETLKDIIADEDKSRPLGDDKLAKALNEKGIKIARRTVAKYRDQMGISSARLRKEY